MAITIEQIKRMVIIALASDDQLMETLVLKGGNAIDLLQRHRKGALARASYDLDFSMEYDFDENLEEVKSRIEKTITQTFEENGLVVIDFGFASRPSRIGDELKDFWGGYNIEFKVVMREQYESMQGDKQKMSRSAIAIFPGGSPRIEIEISKYEFIGDKEPIEVDGYTIFIYSAKMIVFEKVRAICQQLPAYATIIPSHSPRPRARDFYDIHLIMTGYGIDPSTEVSKRLLTNIFAAKRVPLEFIRHIQEHLSIHRQDWQNVIDTISAQEQIRDFDFYVQYVLSQFQPLTFL